MPQPTSNCRVVVNTPTDMLKTPRLITLASWLVMSLAASGADVSYYVVAKGKAFNQYNAAGPVAKNNPAQFFAAVGLTLTNSVTNATVQFQPSGNVNPT